ncbi:MAG: hypothetical protein UZ21_OP11001000644 [Microgenomates bacterium OLB22]|nr:MAG: hypothetical protein UZ21_OP11001000644 [Microgenomates bacterium OLB22]
MDTASKQPATSSQLPTGSGGVTANKPKRNNLLLFSFIVLALLTIGALVLTLLNLQQKQSTSSKADSPACPGGGPPLPIDPNCTDELLRGHVQCKDIDGCTGLSAAQKATIQSGQCPNPLTKIAKSALPEGHGCRIEFGCTAPREGYCKEKGDACYECRFGDGRGLVTGICPCRQPTPTTTIQTKCPSPNQCLPKEQCDVTTVSDTTPNTVNTGVCPIAGQLCCKPKTKVVCESPFQCLPAEECVPDSLNPNKEATINSCAAAGTVCCVKKQKVTPTPGNCPLPEAVTGVKVTCPNCTK